MSESLKTLSCKLALVATLGLGGAHAPAAATDGDDSAEVAPAAEQALPLVDEEQAPEPWYLSDLLDPGHPAEQRERLLANLVLEAEQGHDRAANVLGHLHFLGPDHPSALLEQRLDLAEHHFRLALDVGDPLALRNLAEVALARGNPGEAMVWLQAYLIFEEHRGNPAQDPGYAAELLARIERAGSHRAIGRNALVQRVQALMDSHGARMLAHQNKDRTTTTGMRWTRQSLPDECRDYQITQSARWPSETFVSRRTGPGSGLAHYLVSISPQGDLVDVRVLSSMPEADMATKAEPFVREMSFVAVDDGCPLRWVNLPLHVTDRNLRMR